MEICPYRIRCMKLFIFDFGEVILGNVDTFHPLSNLIGISYDELMADYSLYEMPLMDGYMSVEDYYRHLEMKYEMVINGNPFGELFCPTINTWMLDNVKELRSHGFRCVVGSNTFKPHWDIIKKMGVLENFDALYPSHEIHLQNLKLRSSDISAVMKGFPLMKQLLLTIGRRMWRLQLPLVFRYWSIQGMTKTVKPQSFSLNSINNSPF